MNQPENYKTHNEIYESIKKGNFKYTVIEKPKKKLYRKEDLDSVRITLNKAMDINDKKL